MMKIKVEKASLIQVLQKVQSITDKKTSMPVLSNTLIKATDQNKIEFSATDLDLSVWTQIEAEVEAPGGTTVSAKKLLEIVRELPLDRVALEMIPVNQLHIEAGRAHFQLATIPPEDFPHMNFYQGATLGPCDISVLKKSIAKTIHGVPMEDDPFSIAGLFLHTAESGELRFVSSDGHRLAYYEIPRSAFPDLDIGNGIIIPRKGAQEILKILEKETEASVGIHENCLILSTPETLLSVQLLEAEFPEYQLIIPEDRPFSFTVEWESIHSALKRVAILTNQKWRHVRFVITSGTLELEAGNPEVGNATETLDIDYQGEPFTIAFNIRYVQDTVQATESSHVRFEWVDQYHGGVILGTDDPGYLSLIMPMVV